MAIGTRGLCSLPSSLLFLTVLSGPSALDETLKSSHELVSLLFGAVLLLLFFLGGGCFCFVLFGVLFVFAFLLLVAVFLKYFGC